MQLNYDIHNRLFEKTLEQMGLRGSRLLALMEAYLVTFLWSSSYVLVKIGLTQLSPLTLAALRYITASAIIVPLALLKGEAVLFREAKTFLKLVFLGFSGYTIAQGLQCVGLFYLPSVCDGLV